MKEMPGSGDAGEGALPGHSLVPTAPGLTGRAGKHRQLAVVRRDDRLVTRRRNYWKNSKLSFSSKIMCKDSDIFLGFGLLFTRAVPPVKAF
jgi:hypothetical protein